MVENFVKFVHFISEHQDGLWSGYPSWGPDGKGNYYVHLSLLFFGEEKDAMPAI